MAHGRSVYEREQEVLREVLREARQAAGLRQADLAARLAVPQSYVSKYETGERRLDVVELRRVCNALNTTLAAFVGRFEERLTTDA